MRNGHVKYEHFILKENGDENRFIFNIIGFFNVYFQIFQFLIKYKIGLKYCKIHLSDIYECSTPKPRYIEKTKL